MRHILLQQFPMQATEVPLISLWIQGMLVSSLQEALV
jgi:hypothetical protein